MDILNSILSKIGEYLVEATVSQVGYLVHFKSNIEDLKKEAENLRLVQERVQNDVDRALRNTEVVEGDVQKWLTDVCGVLADVQKLEDEVQANKTCLNGWCPNWGWRYRSSKEAEKKATIMPKLQDSGKLFNRVSHRITLPSIESFVPKDFLPAESRNYAFDKIIEALKDDRINMIGLYGMGGVGKTTLAKIVANKVKEEKNFEVVVMVAVSQTPSLKNIQGQIADFLGLDLEKESEEIRASRLCSRLKNEKNILIILDDVWKKLDFPTIGIPFGDDHKGCKIFLTTRRLQVCVVMGCQAQIPLNVLNEGEGLTLFKRHAGVGDNAPTLNDMAIEVARECKGLPLAIVIIGSALKGKDIEEWKVVFKKLRNSKAVDIDNADEDIYGRLKLSYDYLKGEETKKCFLLCSLFPEDCEIYLKKLLIYGIGLGLYEDAISIKEARSELHVMINQLKTSCLLLDGNTEECVKMHDIIRDVALWVASRGNNVFMVKAGMGLTEWPTEKSLEHCTAISLMGNHIKVLPNRLFCPALEILLLEGARGLTKVSEQFFEEVRGLKVLSLSYCDLSLKSIQLLTNLKTLELIACKLRDLFWLVKLNKLEILSFRRSFYDELPRELGELSKLRLLDLDEYNKLGFRLFIKTKKIRIPSNVIRRCSQLEELYIGDSFTNWEVKETSTDQNSNASLFELTSLSCLVQLNLRIDTTCLPKDFAFRYLERYVICMNTDYVKSYPRAVSVSKIEATSLTAFRLLYQNVEYFYLKKTLGCQNILPSIDQGGLNELKSLELRRCSDLKFIIDTSQHHLPASALSNLVKLSLNELFLLKDICCDGRLPRGLLQKMETINVSECPNMSTLFPTVLLLRLLKLREVEISSCDQLQEVFQFQLEGLCYPGKENDLVLLPSLSKLKLRSLPKLSYIWKGPTHHVNLKTLTYLHIVSCEILELIFPISIARGLVELEELIIEDAHQLTQVFYLDHEEEEIVAERDEKSIVFPKLRKLTLTKLPSLTNFVPKHYHSTCMSLEELKILRCSSLTVSLIFEIKIQDLNEKLRVLEIEDCHHELCDELMLICLRHGFKNLEELRIKGCAVKMVFPLEGPAIDGQNELLFRNLKELSIEDCGELEQIFVDEDHMQPISFPNLSIINVKRCNKLKHLFPISIAQSLQKLQDISLEDCGELEQIIVEEDLMQPLFFPNLLGINVERCNKLKHLFPITIAQSLQKLQCIRLEDCGELEQIIVEEDHMQPLSFPNLSRIKVKRCNKLKHLFSSP